MKVADRKKIKKLNEVQSSILGLLIMVVCIMAFSIANAMPIQPSPGEMENMSEEEKAVFMQNKPIDGNGEAGQMSNQGPNNFSQMENGGRVEAIDQVELEKRIMEAKTALEKNQMRLRVAKNIITSTVSQLKLEGTDIEELSSNSLDLENKMKEIETLYQDHLNKLLLFQRDENEDPGNIGNVFNQAKEKKEELVSFYKNVFRDNLEDALDRNKQGREIE